jgi:hypothetical protein
VSPRRDLATRYLGLVARLLPRARADWGHAMRAELAVIDDPAKRRRFALGCTAAIGLPGALVRPAAAVAAIAGLVALSRVIGLAVPLVVILALLVAFGRRPGHLGPVRAGRAARGTRALGGVLVASLVAVRMVDGGLAGLFRPTHGGTLWTFLITMLAVVFLAATARATLCSDAALATGAVAGLLTGLAGFAVLPFERIGTPLAHGLPWHGRWLIVAVFAAPAVAALVTGSRTRSSDQSVMAVACAGAIAALTVALLGFASIALFPRSIPNIVGPVMSPGTTAAARQAENAIEASDPYWGFLAFGALLAVLFWAVARPPSKADVKLFLLAGLAVPAIALALVGSAGTIAFATAAVVLVAAVTTRREVANPG